MSKRLKRGPAAAEKPSRFAGIFAGVPVTKPIRSARNRLCGCGSGRKWKVCKAKGRCVCET